jgi:AcrR family transcriptional regulator
VRVKTEQKSREIIEVAGQVFRAKGFAAATMAEVAARLGGSKATLYNYFASKEALFAAVMLDMGRKVADPIFSELEQARDGRAGIKTFARRLVHVLATSEVLDFKRMMAAEGPRSGLGKLCFADNHGRYQGKFAEFYRRQVAIGIFRDADPLRAATHLEGLCSAGAIHNLMEGVVDSVPATELTATADAAADVFLRAYTIEPRGRSTRRPKVRRVKSV